MSFVFLTFAIGVLNLCLGYALAVYLGYAPPSLLDAWDALTSQRLPALEPLGAGMVEKLGATSLEDTPESGDLKDEHVETWVLKLSTPITKSEAKCSELGARLRSAAGHSDVETIQRCATELKEDCETYLAEQSEATERFRERIGELGQLRRLGDEIEMANLEQAAQIETTLNGLEQMDFESDPEAANRRLLEEIGRLRVARHKLQGLVETLRQAGKGA